MLVPALEVKTLKASAVVTATAVSSAVDLLDYEGPITFILQSTASGTGVTNAIKLVDDDASGGSFASDVASGGFTTVANTASQQVLTLDSGSMKRYVKLSFTVAGGTGEGVVSCSIVGRKKYS